MNKDDINGLGCTEIWEQLSNSRGKINLIKDDITTQIINKHKAELDKIREGERLNKTQYSIEKIGKNTVEYRTVYLIDDIREIKKRHELELSKEEIHELAQQIDRYPNEPEYVVRIYLRPQN